MLLPRDEPRTGATDTGVQGHFAVLRGILLSRLQLSASGDWRRWMAWVLSGQCRRARPRGAISAVAAIEAPLLSLSQHGD